MGIHGHDDTFIINDIAFTVPPTQISVDKDAVNHNWQTLRSTNSQTVKSGKGVVSIRFTAVFVGIDAINTQLRPLIAQLVLTPICFAENQFIKDTLDVDAGTSVALILKSLSLTVQPELKDSVVAHFDFAWFNYKPYVPELRFKRDVLDNTPEISPTDSDAWKKFYLAEMGESGSGSPKYARVPGNLTDSLSFSWNELFLERENLNGPAPETIRRTEIVYETTNQRENGLRLFTADRKLECGPTTGLIVTSATILFENIVAALPVLGHQYMTYQHIGSLDPRVILEIAAVGDAPKNKVTEMWTMLQEDALKFRHVPQEFLATTIQNDLINLAGLKLFVPESMTSQTIPGQPGTYSLNMRLKAVEYQKTRERLQAEYVTQNQVREEIFKVLNGTVSPKQGLLLETWKTNIPDTPDRAVMHDLSERYAELLSNSIKFAFISITSGAIAGPTLTKLAQFHRAATVASLPLPPPLSIGLAAKAAEPLPGENLVASGHNPLAKLARKNLDLLEKDNSELFKLVRSAVIDQLEITSREQIRQNGSSYLETLRALPVPTDDQRTLGGFLDTLGKEASALADKITQDGTIDLPEFRAAKEMTLKMGSFRGASAYPDFPALEVVASQEGIDPLQLDPSFYFYSPAVDGLTNLIDPGMMLAAESAAKTLYTEQVTTGSTPADFINSIERFVEDNYVNRFDPNSPARKSLDSAKTRIQSIFPAKRIKQFKSKMMPSTVADLEYSNALGKGRPLSSFKQSQENSLNEVPASDTEVFVQSAVPLTHNTEVDHVFSEDPAEYSLPEIKGMGLFMKPITAITTSPYGPRNVLENPEASKFHKGIDIRAKTGTPVAASSNGVVVRAGLQDPDNDKVGWGQYIRIKHDNGYSSVYAHLSDISVKVHQRVEAGDIIGFSGGNASDFGSGNSKAAHLHFEIWNENDVKLDPEKVLAGAQFARDTSHGEGARFGTSLLARSVESLQDSLINGQGPSMARAYPTFKLYFMEEDQEDRIFGFDDFFSYHSVKSIRVVRSRKVPADLCVIELTNISGILSNRKFANEFNNKGEPIGSKARDEVGKVLEEQRRNVLGVNTAGENPIASLMLQQGTRVNLRLGYSNDPDKLDDVFVGQITEVEFNNTDDLVTIVCQSYATELVQMVKGLDKPDVKSGWFLGTNRAATARLLSDLLQEPEVLHFGRWIRSRSNGVKAGIFSTDKGSNTNLDVLSNRYAWRPRPQDDNIFVPTIAGPAFTDYFSTQNFSNTNEATSFANYMLDAVGVPPSFQFSFLTYNITKNTIWDVFKEMELRHPGCIASPVPYRDARQGPRMTMFFGFPNQLYFARDPSPIENRKNSFITQTIKNNQDQLTPELDRMHDLYGIVENSANERMKRSLSAWLETQVGLKLAFSPTLNATTFGTTGLLGLGIAGHGMYRQMNVTRSIKQEQLDAYDKHIRRQLALKDKTIRPFRNYHILTSNNHIIENNVCASALDVYNAVAIEATSDSFMKKLINTLTPGQNKPFEQTTTFRLKADAGIPDEEVREAFLQYPNCQGEFMAEAYALGALKNLLRDIYKGEIITIGNPSIKPYDICYIFDEYTDMVGPVEVEQVVHFFSQETGFVTEITPDICVNINEWTTLGTMDGIGLVVESLIGSVFGRPLTRISEPGDVKIATSSVVGKLLSGTSAAVGITLPMLAIPGGQIFAGSVAATGGGALGLGLTGAFVMSKLVHWSKFRHPIALSPLLYKGRPLMAGMGNKVVNANWWTDLTKWYKDGVDGVGLFFGDITDRLVLASSTGNLSSLGITNTNF